MNIIAKSRGMGKSWDIVKRSFETAYPILCVTTNDEKHYRDIAKLQGKNPNDLKVIVYSTLPKRWIGSSDSQKYIIDEAEYFLKYILSDCTKGQITDIDTISINYENIDENSSNDKKIEDNISYLLDLYSSIIKDKNCDYGKVLNILKNIDMLRGQLNNKNQ